jgi:hypothetical protein
MISLANGIISATAFGGAQAALEPFNRQIAQDVNQRIPNLLPAPSTLIAAHQMGILNDANFAKLMGYHGASVNLFNGLPIGGDIYSAGWASAYRAQQAVPMPAQAMQAYIRGVIDYPKYSAIMRRAGSNPDWWEALLRASYNLPTPNEALVLRNRDVFTNADLDAVMLRNGYQEQVYRNAVESLRFQVPSLSDLVHFQVREVFDPAIANRLRLYDERPVNALKWFQWQGYGWGPGFNIVSDGQNIPALWADLYWGSHWQNVSPTQAYRMRHLYRANRLDRYAAVGLNVQEFTVEDLRRFLRIADYPPGVRDLLAGLSYLPLRLVDIRNAYFRGARDVNWLREQLLDRGYLPSDVEDLIALYDKQKEDKAKSEVDKATRKAVSAGIQQSMRLYRLGSITAPRFEEILRNFGAPAPSATLVRQGIDARIQGDKIADGIRSIRSGYLRGVLDLDQVRVRLKQIGITDERIEDYVDRWLLALDERRRVASGSQIIKWAKLGLLDPATARLRLIRLGWSGVDADLQLAEAQIAVLKTQAQAILAAQKKEQAFAKEIERLALKSEQTTRKLQSDLRRVSPVTKLQNWIVLEYISPDFFRRRMAAMAYPPGETEFYLAEAIRKQREQSAKRKNGQAQETTATPGP